MEEQENITTSENNLRMGQRWANRIFTVGSQRWAIVDLLVGAMLAQ